MRSFLPSLVFCSFLLPSEAIPVCLTAVALENGEFKEAVHITPQMSCECFISIVCRDSSDENCLLIKDVRLGCASPGNETTLGFFSSTNSTLRIFYDGGECKSAGKECEDHLFRYLYEAAVDAFDAAPEAQKNRLKNQWRSGMYAIARRDGGGNQKITVLPKYGWINATIGLVILGSSVLGLLIIHILDYRHQKSCSQAQKEEESVNEEPKTEAIPKTDKTDKENGN